MRFFAENFLTHHFFGRKQTNSQKISAEHQKYPKSWPKNFFMVIRSKLKEKIKKTDPPPLESPPGGGVTFEIDSLFKRVLPLRKIPLRLFNFFILDIGYEYLGYTCSMDDDSTNESKRKVITADREGCKTACTTDKFCLGYEHRDDTTYCEIWEWTPALGKMVRDDYVCYRKTTCNRFTSF